MEERSIRFWFPPEIGISHFIIVHRLALGPPCLSVQWVQRDSFPGGSVVSACKLTAFLNLVAKVKTHRRYRTPHCVMQDMMLTYSAHYTFTISPAIQTWYGHFFAALFVLI